MSIFIAPDVGSILIQAHKTISNLLEATIQASQGKGLDAALRNGFRHCLRSLATGMQAHQVFEAQIALPFWRQKYPLGPLEALNFQAGHIARLLEKINVWLQAGDAGWEEGVMAGLHQVLVDLGTVWNTYVLIEEDHLAAQVPEEIINYADQSRPVQQVLAADPLTPLFMSILFNLELESCA